MRLGSRGVMLTILSDLKWRPLRLRALWFARLGLAWLGLLGILGIRVAGQWLDGWWRRNQLCGCRLRFIAALECDFDLISCQVAVDHGAQVGDVHNLRAADGDDLVGCGQARFGCGRVGDNFLDLRTGRWIAKRFGLNSQ